MDLGSQRYGNQHVNGRICIAGMVKVVVSRAETGAPVIGGLILETVKRPSRLKGAMRFLCSDYCCVSAAAHEFIPTF